MCMPNPVKLVMKLPGKNDFVHRSVENDRLVSLVGSRSLAVATALLQVTFRSFACIVAL